MAVLRHEDAQGGHALEVRAPAAASPLRGLVSSVEDFTEWSAAPLLRREVAIPQVVLILDLGGDGWQVGSSSSGPSGSFGSFGSFVAGLHDRPTVVGHAGRARCMQVNLTPVGARALLGMPLRELANLTVPVDELPGCFLASLVERLAGAPSAEVRFALLEHELRARALAAPAVRPDVVWAWRRLVASGGSVSVSALAAELGCSRRHLTGRFSEELGLAPKPFARVLRFGRAMRALLDGGSEGLAAVAAACGYADQSHLNREFRSLAGATPTAVLRARIPGGGGVLAEFPFVQDGAGAGAVALDA
jgi:AraC-like DNA-binding protein